MPRADNAREDLSDHDFRHAFLHGRITPWKHKDYIRAASLALLSTENSDVGLLDVATKFAAEMNSFKQRNSRIQLLPESRTMTVFWLYQVQLALNALRVDRQDKPEPAPLNEVFEYHPQLLDEKLPASYYSPDMLKSPDAEKFWMLPNLRELVEPNGEQHEDPDRLLRFAFAVVQRYLQPDETRRRSWFINLAFASLQKHTMQLRSMNPLVSPFSETQSYFYIQLVHAALSQLIASGTRELVQELSYPVFKDIFRISPSAWTTHYTPKLWNSVEARARFVPPDRKPLPDTIELANFSSQPTRFPADPTGPFRKLGLVSELPSFEILHFHQAVLLETAKLIEHTPDPAEVTTHAHLLKYIHAHLIQPTHRDPGSVTRSSLLPLFQHHLTLLTTTSPLPKPHITNTLTLVLHYLHPPEKDNKDYNPPPPPPRVFKSYIDPETKKYIHFHSCPCHADLPLPDSSAEPVRYPVLYPYDHPPQIKHACECHKEVDVDQDRFAARCAVEYEERERWEKMPRGTAWPSMREWDRGKWGEWVVSEGGLVVCWEGCWRVLEGREGEFGVGELVLGEETQGVGGEEGGGAEEAGRGEQGEGAEKRDEAMGEDADADERTLAEEEGDRDEWEVVSQETVC